MKQSEHQAHAQLGRYAAQREFERRKQEWLLANRKCSAAEYSKAMRRIAQECGVWWLKL